MNSRTTAYWWKIGMLLSLFCLWHTPGPARAAEPLIAQIPTGPLDAQGNPSIPDYYTTANWANSPPLAKFVDTLPGLGSGKKNNLGQYLSVGKPDVTSYPGSDYYEIELVEYRERMHSDLPAPGTLLRGYRQVNRGSNLSPGTLPSQNLCGADRHACTPLDAVLPPDPVHYLGPNLIAERDRPVRIKFTNRLPSGPAGNLFIPVDTTLMGAGTGPASPGAARGQGAPCDNTAEGNSCASYTQNRAAIHLHGGRTPWVSDGTPHQWITPVEEVTPFTKGVSFQNVPDMPDPGDGSATYYYSNQQSSRLLFYHDHAFGITRLNVYAGEAAGYLITDQYEQDLVARGLIPPDQIALIIQDKTFVDASEIRKYDPLWNWGSATPDASGVRPPVEGDLWLPHVYMPAQTQVAGDGGVNPFGRWMYGPWFFPATQISKGPVANPYYDPDCSSPDPAVYANCTTPGQPSLVPGTPHPSVGMEAFQDSALVNGTVFPTLTVDPRAYRFRILNAASDRFFNLSLYQADPAQVSPDPRPASRLTEVKTVTASEELARQQNWPELWPIDGRDGGVPDPALRGPSFLQIGSESGFLPQPVQIDPQPITYFTDPTAFWVGNVDRMGLGLGPAERADVIVDFSGYAGKTLILYNDAPAAWPARVRNYDYFTGAADQRDSGGYGAGGVYNPVTGVYDGGHGILPGYGPNTRTVLQIIVTSGTSVDPPYSFNRENLEREFVGPVPVTPANPTGQTLFQRAQDPIIVGQAAYSSAYPGSYFPTNFPWEGISQINDTSLNFVTVAGDQVVVPMEPKGLHDEMGASFDPVYGRMSGNLGMQLPHPTTLNALLVLYGYPDIPTEFIDNSPQVQVSVIPGTTDLADGTQIWKISHNGVDTHPIHFHIFDVQVINRVGWDGQILMPEANELGWKETVKISPLEDTIVAVRPRAPLIPFGVPNSLRPLNPAIPLDSPMGFNSVDWRTGQAVVPPVTNILYDFKWEYVWHCHILSHEEMDMMRPIVLNVPNSPPAAPVLNSAGFSGSSVNLAWTDATPRAGALGNTSNEIGFRIQRCAGSACANFATIATVPANQTGYQDYAISQNTTYRYRMFAFNASGNSNNSAIRSATTAGTINPTVAITAPVNNMTYNAGEPIVINAQATVRNGVTITNVRFLDGAILLASDTQAPYSYTWNGASVGTHTVRAVVTPSTGAPVTSAPVTVIVNTAPAAAPGFITVPATSATGNYTVSWTASTTPGATYTLQESTTVNFAATTNIPVGGGGSALSADITGKQDGTSFYYRVRATAPGTSASAWTVGLTPCVVSYPTSPPASITVPAGSGTGTYTVSWTASTTPGASYTLQESTTANFDPASTTTVATGLAGTSRLISGKTNGTYYYRVQAVAAGFSSYPWTAGTNGCTVALVPVITAPAGGAVLVQGTPTTISADVFVDLVGGVVLRVEFYDNGILVGTDTTQPYSVAWTPAGGTHNLTAFAYYANSTALVSAPVTVTASSAPPTITIDLPTSGAVVDLGSVTTITTTPSAVPGASVFVVGFYENGTLLGYASAPYSFSWTPAVTGARSLTATAFYDNFATATSAARAVTVNGTVLTPASITVPATSTTGSYAISWTPSATAGATHVLQESSDPAFGSVTEILNAVSPVTITGKANGTLYYYRVKAVKPPMTDSAFRVGGNGVAVTVPGTAAMLTPANNAVLSGASQAFTWTNSGANLYQVWVGSSPGSFDIGAFPAAGTTATSTTATGLPVNGTTIYVRLWSLNGATWTSNDYTYTASGSQIAAAMTAPLDNATLAGASQAFTWSNTGANLYQLWIGSSPGGLDIGAFPPAGTTATGTTATGLPVNGSTVYVRLWSKFGNSWLSNDYTYTASGVSAPATITTPVNASTLPGLSVAGGSIPFAWSNTGANLYQVWIGTTPGSFNVGAYPAAGTTATSTTATGLPAFTAGTTLYVRLWSRFGASWVSNDYSYTSGI